jgi:hypothetical protein
MSPYHKYTGMASIFNILERFCNTAIPPSFAFVRADPKCGPDTNWTRNSVDLAKPLISLARPTGIEPVFSP